MKGEFLCSKHVNQELGFAEWPCMWLPYVEGAVCCDFLSWMGCEPFSTDAAVRRLESWLDPGLDSGAGIVLIGQKGEI